MATILKQTPYRSSRQTWMHAVSQGLSGRIIWSGQQRACHEQTCSSVSLQKSNPDRLDNTAPCP